jgi:hypothetical protein
LAVIHPPQSKKYLLVFKNWSLFDQLTYIELVTPIRTGTQESVGFLGAYTLPCLTIPIPR